MEYNLYLILLAVLMVIPTFIDGLTQLLGYRESNNKIRFITGLAAGFGLGVLVKAFKFFLLGDWNIFTLIK